MLCLYKIFVLWKQVQFLYPINNSHARQTCIYPTYHNYSPQQRSRTMWPFSFLLLISIILNLAVGQSYITDTTSHRIPAIEVREPEDCKLIWQTDSRKSKLSHTNGRSVPELQPKSLAQDLSEQNSNILPSIVAPISPRWTAATGWAHVWLFGPDGKQIGYSNLAIIGAEFHIPAGKVFFKRFWVDVNAGRQYGFFLPQVIVNGKPKGQCYDCHQIERKYDECICIFKCSGPNA